MSDFDEEKQKRQLDELRRVEEEQLVAMLAETKYSLPYVDLYRIGIDNEALRAIPETDARSLKIGPSPLIKSKCIPISFGITNISENKIAASTPTISNG